MFHVPKSNSKIVIISADLANLQHHVIYKVEVKGDAVALTYSRFKYPICISIELFNKKLINWEYLNAENTAKVRKTKRLNTITK